MSNVLTAAISIVLKDRGAPPWGSAPLPASEYPISLGDPLVKWAIPDFLGYTETDVTSIDMGASIDAFELSGEAPFSLAVSASNVVGTGVRTKSTQAFNSWEDLHHEWTLTKSNGERCEYGNEIKDSSSNDIVDPFDCQIGGEARFLLREVGSYTLTLTSRGITSLGTYVEESITETVTVTEYSGTHVWIDSNNGSDSNDGQDPLGFALTNATYTEATGELTQAGMFASYDHDEATASVSTDNYNHIYCSGELREIASKVDDDTIILKDKIGADATGITSSTGPLLSIQSPDESEFYHYAGDFDVSSSIGMYTEDDCRIGGVGTYGAEFTAITDTFSYCISLDTNQTSVAANVQSFHNIRCNANGLVSGGISGNYNGEQNCTSRLTFDRVESYGGLATIGIKTQCAAAHKDTVTRDFNVLFWASLSNNLAIGEESKTHGLYTNYYDGSRVGVIGHTFRTGADDPTYDHHWYFAGTSSNMMLAYSDCLEGNNANYVVNISHSEEAGAIAEYISIHHNRCHGSTYGFDGSNTHNLVDEGSYQNVSIFANSISVRRCAIWAYNYLSLTFRANALLLPSEANSYSALATNAGDDVANWVVDKNVSVGAPLWYETSSQGIELVDNISVMEEVESYPIVMDSSVLTGESVFIRNQLYVPNNTTPDAYIKLDGWNGSVSTLAQFNTAVGATGSDINIYADPNWTDPDNGDFT